MPPVNYLPARDPPSFASSSKTRPGSCGLSILVFNCSARKLPSVVRFLVKLPLLWFSKDCPSTDFNITRPVPAFQSMIGRPSASRCQTSRTFRPCRSSRLRRFAPRAVPQVCCTLQPVMGFEAFPVQSPFLRIAATVGPLCLSRTRSSYPSKCFPHQQPFCVTTFVSFPSLFPIPVSSLRSRDLKAFLR